MKEFRCPSCKGVEIEFHETATLYRMVYGVEDGELRVASEYRVNDEDTSNYRFHCCNCHHEWNATRQVLNKIDWI